LAAGLTAGVAAVVATAAFAVVPDASKIANAIAKTNESSGRAVPLLFEVTLSISETPVATGVLAAHPTGLARLELRNDKGVVERHLLQGNDYLASRNGELLDAPRPFLPPVFLLQASTVAALQAALGSFGVATGEAEFGRVDDIDCYVVGGRARASEDDPAPSVPSVWVDTRSYQVVRVIGEDGVELALGPTAIYGGVIVPGWVTIESPDHPPARLTIDKVAPADAPAAAFSTEWLTAQREDSRP
jgi:hypothetical protein